MRPITAGASRLATGAPAASRRSTGSGSGGPTDIASEGAAATRSVEDAGEQAEAATRTEAPAAADWAARPAALELSVLPGPPGVHVGVAELADALG